MSTLMNWLEEAEEMVLVQGPRAADRERYPMQRQRIIRTELGEEAMGWAALPHIILGMHFEKIRAVAAAEDIGFVRRLEAQTDARALERRPHPIMH